MSEEELEFITGERSLDRGVEAVRNRFDIPLICITMGKKGSRAYYGDHICSYPLPASGKRKNPCRRPPPYVRRPVWYAPLYPKEGERMREMEKVYDVTAIGELLIDFTENGVSAQGNPLLEANPGGAPCNVLAMLNMNKNFMEDFKKLDADIFCLQETKLQEGQIDLDLPGYHQYWNYAEKKKNCFLLLFYI